MKLLDYTLLRDKNGVYTLWINYKDAENDYKYTEIPISVIIKLLYEAGEVYDYSTDILQIVIVPDDKHLIKADYNKLHSNRILLTTTKFWSNYLYKEKAIELYLTTLNKNHG